MFATRFIKASPLRSIKNFSTQRNRGMAISTKNYLVAAGIITFVTSVYYYSIYRMKNKDEFQEIIEEDAAEQKLIKESKK